MNQHKKNAVFILPTIRLITILSIVFPLFSCSFDASNTQLNNTISINTNYSYQNQVLGYLSKYNNTADTTKILILLVNKEVNEYNLATELNATLLSSLTINEKKYIRISGLVANTKALQDHTSVLSIEPDLIRQSYASPNDTSYSQQYAPQLTGLESVWENYTGTGVTVAVIDTGVNTLHEDFGDSSAFVRGWDYSSGKEYSTTTHNDENGHGTHVAGIIGARKDNGKGIVGVAPEATIMPIRASGVSAASGFTSFNIGAAIKYAADNGAHIINLSLGGIGTSGIEGDAISYALKKNVVIIAASGNDSTIIKNYPASYPGVISVASSNGRDEVSSYSTRNSHVSVAAPGEEIYSLLAYLKGTSSSSYVSFSGTSMAAPFVSGLAALLKEKFPTAAPAQIKEILETTAKDIDVIGKDDASGHGRVDPVAALATTSLPDISWTEVEYTVSYEATKVNNYSINVLDSNNILYTTAITGSDGIASFFLPKGNYTISSAHYGVMKKESITLADTKLTKSIEFSTNDFANNYYRVSTYFDTQDVDTILGLFRLDGDLLTGLDVNLDKSSTDTYSEIIFLAISGIKYYFTVNSLSSTNNTGSYRIILEHGIPLALPTSSAQGSRYDETNDDFFPMEDLVLVPGGNPRYGTLALDDFDWFTFIAP